MQLNPELQQSVRDVNRKKKAEEKITDLENQLKYLHGRAIRHKQIMEDSEANITRLNSRSLSVLFLNSEKKQEKLVQERKKVYEAAVDYDSIIKQIKAAEEDLAETRQLLKSLDGCEARYQKQATDYRKSIQQVNGVEANKVVELQYSIASYDAQKKEVLEAVEACQFAKKEADAAYNLLQKAIHKSLFSISVSERVDLAQKKIEDLLIAVRRCKNELGDVHRFAENSSIDTSRFLKFADYFFDDIFETNETFEIQFAVAKVEEIRWKLEEVEAQLHLLNIELGKRETYLKKQLSQHILITK